MRKLMQLISHNASSRVTVALEVIDGATTGTKLADCYAKVGFAKCGGAVPEDKVGEQWDVTMKALIEQAGGAGNMTTDTHNALQAWAYNAGQDAVLMVVQTVNV